MRGREGKRDGKSTENFHVESEMIGEMMQSWSEISCKEKKIINMKEVAMNNLEKCMQDCGRRAIEYKVDWKNLNKILSHSL